MTVIPSDLVPKNDPIASVDDLWEPSALFLPNWEQDVRLSSAYRGVVSSSRDVSEQRLLMAKKPRRTLSYSLRSYDGVDSQRARSALTRLSRARTPMPLWTDGVQLTGKPLMDTTQYTGDFEDKRFQVGARVCALREDSPGISTQFKYAKITAISDTQITLDSDLDEDYDTAPSVRWHDHDFNLLITPTTGWATGEKAPVFEAGECIFATLSVMSELAAGLVSAKLYHIDDDEYTDITASVFHNVSTDRGDPTYSFLNSLALVYVVPKPGHYRIEWTLQNPAFQGYQSITVVKGVHQGEPIHATAGGEGATVTSDQRIITLPLNPDRAHQLVLMGCFAGAIGSETFNQREPNNEGAFLLNQFGVGPAGGSGVTQQGSMQEYETTAPGAVNVGAWLATGGEGNDEGFQAAAVVFNPAESNGFDRDFIFPVIECDLELGNKARIYTDSVNEAEIELVETPGETALDPEVDPGSAPPGATIGLDNYPILELPIDWNGVEIGHYRVGKRDISGITTVLQAYGSKPGKTFTLPFFAADRHEAWDVLEFFDSRGGRAFPFWLFMPSPVMYAETMGVTPGVDATLYFAATTTERDWEQYTHIGVYDKTLKQRTVHKITQSVEAAGLHIIVMEPSLPDDDETRYEFYTAHLCRFEKEAFDESWVTNETERVVLMVKELLNEQDITVSLLDLCGVGGGDPWTPNNDFDLCADDRCGTTDPEGCCLCGIYGLGVTAYCYIGECETGDCGVEGACIENGSCAIYLAFESCTNGVARWSSSQYNIWVELDTDDGTWSYDITDWLFNADCCDEVDQGTLCACIQTDSCYGDYIIETETCTAYIKEHACDRYNNAGGPCTFVVTLEMHVQGGGGGSADCA